MGIMGYFFFKQKTAYEMRISDWSSDVCSSDLVAPIAPASPDAFRLAGETPRVMRLSRKTLAVIGGAGGIAIAASHMWALRQPAPARRQGRHRGVEGKGGASRGGLVGCAIISKKKNIRHITNFIYNIKLE